MSNRDPTSVLRGAFLTVSMRWADRLIGFLSTLILARLLIPDDFGIVAMASLVIGLVDILMDLGVSVVLIQNKHPTPAHYHTAWTLRLIQACTAAVVVLIIAPYAAAYFNDARIEFVLKIMTTGLVLAGLENIGVITFQKEMRFGLDFRYVFIKRVVSFVATIAFAWALRSYWALIIGMLTSRVLGVLLSYQMHPMRPVLSLEKVKEIFTISLSMLMSSIGGYLNGNLHKFTVGKIGSASTLGGYTLADEISGLPSSEILAPLNRVLFPAFVQVKHNLLELKRVFLIAQGVQTLIAVPASVGLALVAHEAVAVLLGEKWLFCVPFVQLLAVASVVQAITTSGGYVMITLGHYRNLAILGWAQVILFTVCLGLLPKDFAAIHIAMLRLFVVFAGLALAIWMLMRTIRIVRLLDIISTVIRPLIAATLMVAVIILTGPLIPPSPFFALIIKISTGIVIYTASIFLLWYAARKPQGAETYILNKMRHILRSR